MDNECKMVEEKLIKMKERLKNTLEENLIHRKRQPIIEKYISSLREEIISKTKDFFRISQELRDLKRFTKGSIPKDEEIQGLLNSLLDSRTALGAHQSQNSFLMQTLQRLQEEKTAEQEVHTEIIDMYKKDVKKLQKKISKY